MTLFEDPFVERYREKERAEEDVYFGRHDRELLAHLHETGENERRGQLRALVHMRCPECGAHLRRTKHQGVAVEECPIGHGLWMKETDCREIASRSRHSWLGRYIYPPRLE